ncbi:MAG: phosphate/phosphite/phosphonate ABC transporter substrate-binding protein [Candidatus Riflebacteria bacterium]|nr:phosphate/phosphite/phosphonate ABC transporter substrate-binding protein [Candidatus Riflebacteria bacterium]
MSTIVQPLRWLCLILALFLVTAPLPGHAQGGEYSFPDEGYSSGETGEASYVDDEPVFEDYTSQYESDPDALVEEAEGATEPPPASPPPAPIEPRPPVDLARKAVMIGRTPYLSLKEMMRQVAPLFAFLKKEMGVPEVRLVTGKDYASVLATLERGNIDFAWVGPMAYVIGREKGNLMPLAMARHLGEASYRGVFIARKDGPVQGLDDIRGRTIGFVDPESASGYLYPLYLLQRVKIDPHKACKKVYFLKKHDAVLQAVLAGKLDAGVCLEATVTGSTDPRVKGQILVLGRTDPVPSDVLVCRQDCPVNLREAFLAALLKRTATGSAALGDPGDGPPPPTFAPATEADFQSVQAVWNAVRKVARHL